MELIMLCKYVCCIFWKKMIMSDKYRCKIIVYWPTASAFSGAIVNRIIYQSIEK